jgi:hypothetical protein
MLPTQAEMTTLHEMPTPLEMTVMSRRRARAGSHIAHRHGSSGASA